jgi:maltooligosyltrehalose trehalohydrolase
MMPSKSSIHSPIPSKPAPVAGVELGAVPTGAGTRFTLWSTRAKTAAVRLFDGERPLRTEPLTAQGGGIFEAVLGDVRPGALYKFVLDDRELPDPYARFLPFGVHGPARVEARVPPPLSFTPSAFERWILYELHVGTFTPEGTWAAAREKLDALVELGVNAIEVMPIAAFDGARGWGYDGVALFAPFAPYGEPDDLRAFVAACHERSIAVVLDVVYNHFGPAGNYLSAYSPEYFTARHRTAWGDAPDYAEPHLRRMILSNARYWLAEFGFDGLRLDATHAIVDDSPVNVLTEIARLGASLVPKRAIIAEDERNDPTLLTSHGLSAVWADDFHHVLHTLLTGERDGYYSAYAPTTAELARTIDQGWRFQGEEYLPWKKPRGKPAMELAASNFVYADQNHDQVGNRAFGTRLHHEGGTDAHLAALTLLLFLPVVPLVFMGEEWAASSPFLYFTDHDEELGKAIRNGRHEEFAHFDRFSDPSVREQIPDPQATSTFKRSRLDWTERARQPHARTLDHVREMIALRLRDPVLSAPSRARMACEARGQLLVVRRWLGAEERTLVFNPTEVPLAAPLSFDRSDVLFSTTPLTHATEIPARASVLVRTSRSPSVRPSPH